MDSSIILKFDHNHRIFNNSIAKSYLFVQYSLLNTTKLKKDLINSLSSG